MPGQPNPSSRSLESENWALTFGSLLVASPVRLALAVSLRVERRKKTPHIGD